MRPHSVGVDLGGELGDARARSLAHRVVVGLRAAAVVLHHLSSQQQPTQSPQKLQVATYCLSILAPGDRGPPMLLGSNASANINGSNHSAVLSTSSKSFVKSSYLSVASDTKDFSWPASSSAGVGCAPEACTWRPRRAPRSP